MALVRLRANLPQKFSLAFKHDPEKQALVFYTRDRPRGRRSLVFDRAFENLYLDKTERKRLPRFKYENRYVPDIRQMETGVVMSVLEVMGRMPRKREFTVSAISKLFFRRKAFKVGFLENAATDIKLKPGFLLSSLLEDAFERDGKMDLEGYRSLSRVVVENCYVRHGIEADLRYVPGMGNKRLVIFPRKITSREITRCLASTTGIRMRSVRLRILQPDRKTKKLPIRCVVVPARKGRMACSAARVSGLEKNCEETSS